MTRRLLNRRRVFLCLNDKTRTINEENFAGILPETAMSAVLLIFLSDSLPYPFIKFSEVALCSIIK